MTDKLIRGFGGPPSPPTPYRAPDTLNSRQFATILDLISEGEIEGFATPSKEGVVKGTTAYTNASLKDVFLDDTQVLNTSASNTNPPDSLFNFQNVILNTRFGTSNQTKIDGIVTSDAAVSGFSAQDCKKSTGGVSQDIGTGKDAIKVTIMFPQLQKATDEGDLEGSVVELEIRLQINGGTHELKISDKITGRSADPYSKEYRIELPTTYTQANVKILRLTDDSTDEKLKDDFKVTLIQEIIDDANTYPDSAYTSLRLDSEQFNAIPKRAFRIRGIKVRIPSANTNSTTATYTQSATTVTVNSTAHGLSEGDSIIFDATSGNGVDGTYKLLPNPTANSFTFTAPNSQTVTTSNCTYKITPHVDLQTGRINYPNGYVFNGTFGAAQWTSCPSCILLDLLTNERYGFGTFLDPSGTFTSSGTSTTLDLYSFVTASKYANALVNDGFGTFEARFSCNVNISSSKEAYDLIKDLAAVMRCIPTWSQGTISLVQDAPSDPVYLFNLANVTGDGFSYTGSSLKQRHSVVSVSYFNVDSREIDFEVYGDGNTSAEVTRRAKLGVVIKQVKSFGCTSRGQAQRLARAIVFSEEQESEVVSFSTSIDAGSIVRPGSVILINDPVRHGFRRSGRIAAATTTQITIDDEFGLSNFGGTNRKCSVILPDGSVEKKDCSLSGKVITLTSALSATPNVNSIWMLESEDSGESPQTFRVISVDEEDGVNYSISALSYRSEKYNNIESVDFAQLPPRSTSLLNQPAAPPVIHTPIREEAVTINNISINKIILSWSPIKGVTQYQVQYRFQNSNWVTQIVFRPDIEIMNTQAGFYEFRVFSFNSALKLSSIPSTAQLQATGKRIPPADVQNLTAEPVSNNLIRLRWNKSINADVLHGGRVYIRHSNKTDGTGTFANSVDLIQAVAGNSTDVVVPSLEGEYILKFRDDQGLFSQGETSVIIDLPDLIDNQVVFTDREDTDSTPFDGTKNNTTVLNGALKLTNPAGTVTGTYSQSGNDITITLNSHGFSVGDIFDYTFTTGAALNGQFPIISVTNANVFVVKTGNSNTTTGNVTVAKGLRGSYSFASILDLGNVFSVNLKRHFQSIGFFLGGDPVTATYTQSGTTVTINSTSHGRSVGDSIEFDATSGAGVDGTFQITAVTTNSFTYTAGQSQTVSTSDCTYQFVNTLEEVIPNTSPQFGGPPDGGFDNYAINGNFDGPAAQKTNAQILVASTSSAPSNGSSYQASDFNGKPFNIFANGTFKGRGFKFKLNLSSDDAGQNISIEQAGYTASFNSRTEQSSGKIRTVVNPGVDNTPAAKNVTFSKAFFTGTSSTDGGVNAFPPSVGITIENADAGNYFQLTNISGTGFTCAIKDSSGNLIDKEFAYQAVGYGKGV